MVKFKKYTSDELNHLKKIELMILKDVIDICEKNNLKYYLYAGTALGAIRHGGFIPWDDDIDIIMFREDYEKLLKTNDPKLTQKYDILSFDNQEDCFFPFTKISLKETKFNEWWVDYVSFNEGIFIDIFPLDNTPQSKTKRLIDYYICNILDQSLINSFIKIDTKSFMKNIIHTILHNILKIIPGSSFLKKMFKKYLIIHNNKETEIVTDYFAKCANPKFGKTGFFYKKDFEPSKKVKFEDISANIPNNTDRILTQLYGDYMKIPPEEERYNHAPQKMDFGKY